jgi:hypothetical protein
VAALVFVLMVPVCVSMLMVMHPGLMTVLVPVMGVAKGLVAVLMFMLVFTVAAHAASPPYL